MTALPLQFKGSSASLGASMLANLCIKLRECCQAQNQQGCITLLKQVGRDRSRRYTLTPR